MRPYLIAVLACALFLGGCRSIKYKDINYLDQDYAVQPNLPTLNIYKPKKAGQKKDVLIFVHGGDWNSGNKELYSFFGRNFAKKDVLTIIPDYTLSPNANYDTMAKQVAQAVRWTHENIADFGGDPTRIFLTGHSAGGHLIALVGMNPKYLEDPSIIKGLILNDAAGLDMYGYLQTNPPTSKNDYLATWGKDEQVWKEASPINFISENTPPMLIYLGTKTIPSLFKYNELFIRDLNKVQLGIKPILLDKRHNNMVIHYIWPWSKRFKEIKSFMQAQE